MEIRDMNSCLERASREIEDLELIAKVEGYEELEGALRDLRGLLMSLMK